MTTKIENGKLLSKCPNCGKWTGFIEEIVDKGDTYEIRRKCNECKMISIEPFNKAKTNAKIN